VVVAGRIVKDDIDTLRQQADIVALVGDYTTLRRAGRSYKGLCPFHTERTPSFTVQPDGNFYNCFGCGVSGDIYDFLMRIEGLEFPEAVEALARRTGFQLRYEQLSSREQRAVGERTRLVKAMAAAQAFYREQLYADDGAVARDYLKERGFGRDDAATFELGFAPNRWEDLARALTAQGLPPGDLITVGLVTRTDRGGLRDRFRGRLMFPIQDAGGDVIGFGGRILPALDYGDFEPPKYLNSAETPLYRKARVLYGVPQARAEIVRQELVLVCEGYTDVMALHQGGFANALATCGTAVGTEHLRTIARYAPRVVLAFDGDAAGVKAAERAWEAAREVESSSGGVQLDLRVLALPDGRDPADLVREVGGDGLREAVASATPIVPFLIRHRLRDADLGTEAGRIAALRSAIEVLGKETDADLRREWARTEVAGGVGVSYDHVVRTAGRAGVELDAHEGVAVATPGGAAPRRGRDEGPPPADRVRAKLEKDVLRAAFQHPELLPDEWYELSEDDLAHPVARTLFACLQAGGGVGVPLADVLAAAPDDEVRGRLRAIALEDDPELDEHLLGHAGDPSRRDPEVAAAIVAGRVRRLVAVRVQQEETALRGELSQLNHVTDRDRLLELQGRLAQLHQRRRELTRAE
jgi:DNA primase